MVFAAELSSLAESLREERARAGLTLEQLARRSELSVPHLSRLESGERQPSVAALISLSRALGVPLSTLLGERKAAPAISVYLGEGVTHQANGLTISGRSGFPGSSTIQALHIIIDPDRSPSNPARHRGEEWVYVVSGSLRLEFEDQVHHLPPGATAHFDANCPHRLGAEGVTTEVLVVAADAPEALRNHPLFTSSISSH
jgi:transcriptional regulator with XRE-family HTH domain